ncbi:hypothetical protein [Acutalibacter sp. 1XD8-36]|uniref:hypothetical protein n=1 Tax=Acutalibacter sp. 1XD8-36 TaxID=2320852 RepID=UPI001411CDCF|nr:hypothetical protein [Acutalibacter sp. 1XD8-36]NBJ87887.1 hypothetical protein [Acutalibacter sp. 1XD8-36]
MEGEFISRAEHEEFRRSMDAEHQRLEDENNRQNRRLEILESATKQIGDISTSVEKLALNMENMLKEQISQGKRLTVLESQDGQKWRQFVGYIFAAAVGVIVGFLFKQAGIF